MKSKKLFIILGIISICQYLHAQNPFFNVKNYGAKGDGKQDDLPAFKKAMQAMAKDSNRLNLNAGGVLLIPKGEYLLSGDLEINKCLSVEGAAENLSSILTFSKGFGIKIRKTGERSTFRNLTVYTKEKKIGVHGITLQSRATLEHCIVSGFGGCGIYINSDKSANNGDTVNMNNWVIYRCRIEGCDGDGLYLRGGDSNAGLCMMLELTGNKGCGIRDESLLGNTYISCLAEANGDSPYRIGGQAQHNATVISCYSEEGDKPCDFFSRCIVIGGDLGSGISDKSTAFISSSGLHNELTESGEAGLTEFSVLSGKGQTAIKTHFGSSGDSKTAISMTGKNSGTIKISGDAEGFGNWGLGSVNYSGKGGLLIYNENALPGGGAIVFPHGAYFGVSNIGRSQSVDKKNRRISFSNGCPDPVSGLNTYTRGDVIYDSEMANGRNGWRCDSTGGWGIPWANLFGGDPIYIGNTVKPNRPNGYIYRIVEIRKDLINQVEPNWPLNIGTSIKYGNLTIECYGIDYGSHIDYCNRYFKAF